MDFQLEVDKHLTTLIELEFSVLYTSLDIDFEVLYAFYELLNNVRVVINLVAIESSTLY